MLGGRPSPPIGLPIKPDPRQAMVGVPGTARHLDVDRERILTRGRRVVVGKIVQQLLDPDRVLGRAHPLLEKAAHVGVARRVDVDRERRSGSWATRRNGFSTMRSYASVFAPARRAGPLPRSSTPPRAGQVPRQAHPAANVKLARRSRRLVPLLTTSRQAQGQDRQRQAGPIPPERLETLSWWTPLKIRVSMKESRRFLMISF